MGESDISAPHSGSEAMPVTVRLPGALRDVTGGETKLTASGATLREVIADIDRRHPGFASRVLDPSGGPASHLTASPGEAGAPAPRARGAAAPRASGGLGGPPRGRRSRSTGPPASSYPGC